ncbi:helix-hairpin-helix domain-containing protein [Paracoccus mutanolyticus]|uniref:helix-hairpin-helix domain-containing protein n=1 Tax=Paracoccus mutanolyticus TaxID=1499308 RepID=UPI001CB98C71|nr:OB-fold nucleic acid binding domain-containing protein [Paracoccus mutanolyticus]
MLRKSMATFKFTGGVSAFRDKLVTGMVARGYEPAFAERTFRQLEGFGSYGFPESHAASFALIAYASSWLKCWHPDAFCAALLNSQPMGFYAPAQIVRDAQDHGVEVRPVCVNASEWDCTLEPVDSRFAVRLGLRMVKGLAEAHATQIARAAPFISVEDLWRRTHVPMAALTRIAEADGFHAFGLSRRQAVWAIKGLPDTDLPLIAASLDILRPVRDVPGFEVVEDCAVPACPCAGIRWPPAGRSGAAPHPDRTDAMALPNRRWAEVAGLVLVRQRPGSAKGTMFITLEDETGIANLVVWPKVFEANRRIILAASMIAARGMIQREGEVVHFVVHRLTDLSDALASVGSRGHPGCRMAVARSSTTPPHPQKTRRPRRR